jgi:hypothetical protein
MPSANATSAPGATVPWSMQMNMHGRFVATELMVPGAGASSQPSSLGLLRARLASWVKTLADHYAAAAAYEQLSRFSDVELKNRGLSRDILARDLSEGRCTFRQMRSTRT